MQSSDASTANTAALLNQLRTEMPEIWNQAEVVGQWVWLEFNVAPERGVRTKLRGLGFHWNGKRKCWQHPCGIQTERSAKDPRDKYEVIPASQFQWNETPPSSLAKEYKVVALRECPLPETLLLCDTPDKTHEYWKLNIATNPYFNPDCECFAILMLNTRRRVKGHQLGTLGTMDTLLIHPREVFRTAIIVGAAAIILMHNHPSGESTPSEADIKVTRDLIRAGQLLKMDVLDHVIVGHPNHSSLRELGYFY